MPHPVSQDQTVTAINEVLTGGALKPPGQPIADLATQAMSDPQWSCNTYSPTVLERVQAVVPGGVTTEYAQGAALPGAFADGDFVNVAMLGEPSALNHNFDVLVSGGTTYLTEAYLGHQVRIVQQFANADFIARWHDLSNDVNWVAAYTTLFGVAPADPPAHTWLQSQYVTL
jgi:hypothetical protein